MEPVEKPVKALARHCPTCGATNLTLTPDEPIEGWSLLSCTDCGRALEIGRPGVGPLVDPEWKERPV
jgi:transcription elongation factor Elf1